MMAPVSGTTRYLCPRECGWHHDDPPPSLADAAGIAPDPNVRNLPEAVGSIASKTLMRRLERTEAALRDHLATHTDEGEVAAVRQLLANAGRGDVPWPP